MIRASTALAALLALAGCQAEPVPATPTAATNQVLLPSEEAEVENGVEQIGPLRLRFDPARLTRVGANIAIPPDWTSNVLGVKLLAPERAAMLEKQDCSYGASGSVVRCNADQEAGLALALVGLPYTQLAAALPADQLKPISLAGASGTSWSIGAEGEGANYMLIPAGAAQTALIVRQYRETGNPDAAAVAAALAGLRLSPAAQQTGP